MNVASETTLTGGSVEENNWQKKVISIENGGEYNHNQFVVMMKVAGDEVVITVKNKLLVDLAVSVGYYPKKKPGELRGMPIMKTQIVATRATFKVVMVPTVTIMWCRIPTTLD